MDKEYRPAPMSLAQRAALRSQPPRVLRQPARRRVYPVVVLGLLILVIAVAVGGFEYYYRDRVYPNIYIQPANLAVGGQTQAEVTANLGAFGLTQRYRTVTLRAPNHAPFKASPSKLGYTFDAGLTAFRAVRTGRDGNILQRAKFQVGLITHSVDVAAVQRVDQIALRDFLFKLSGATNNKPGPGVAGHQLDVATAQKRIARALLTTGPISVNLPITTIPALPKPIVRRQPPRHKTTTHKAARKAH